MGFDLEKDIPDLSGKVILVTGGNSGLGRESVVQLSRRNPSHIYLASRDKSKAQAVIEYIHQNLSKTVPISCLELDLSSFDSIRNAAHEFKSMSSYLHLLINNAGVMCQPAGLTKNGYEIQFGTNHMGHALLTELLLPTLQTTASSSEGSDVRVITVASGAEIGAPKNGYDFPGLKTNMTTVNTWNRYCISKLANIHYSRMLAARYPEIKFISVHPGTVSTNLGHAIYAQHPFFTPLLNLIKHMVTTSTTEGVKNQLWAAVSSEAKSGFYYHPVGVSGKGSKMSQNDQYAENLWNWTQQELKGYLAHF